MFNISNVHIYNSIIVIKGDAINYLLVRNIFEETLIAFATLYS